MGSSIWWLSSRFKWSQQGRDVGSIHGEVPLRFLQESLFTCIEHGVDFRERGWSLTLVNSFWGNKINNSKMANMWDFNVCGEFKATMKIKLPIFK